MKRSEVYYTNVVKVRPPANKLDRLEELDMSIDEFIPDLQEELNRIECGYIMPLGNTALEVLTGKKGILKWRGSPLRSVLNPHMLCIPSVHPRFVIDVWGMLGTLITDMKKAGRYVREGYKEVTFNTLTRPSLEMVQSVIHLILTQCDRFVFDIETYRSGQISCIGIGWE